MICPVVGLADGRTQMWNYETALWICYSYSQTHTHTQTSRFASRHRRQLGTTPHHRQWTSCIMYIPFERLHAISAHNVVRIRLLRGQHPNTKNPVVNFSHISPHFWVRLTVVLCCQSKIDWIVPITTAQCVLALFRNHTIEMPLAPMTRERSAPATRKTEKHTHNTHRHCFRWWGNKRDPEKSPGTSWKIRLHTENHTVYVSERAYK